MIYLLLYSSLVYCTVPFVSRLPWHFESYEMAKPWQNGS